jgi:four helix bundle protein
MLTQLVIPGQPEFTNLVERDFIVNRPNALTYRMLAFALQLLEAHHSLPIKGQGRVDSGHLLRSGTKVLSLYRSAYRAHGWTEFGDTLEGATGVAEETLHWLDRLEQTAAVDFELTRSLHLSCREVIRLMRQTVQEVRERAGRHA